MKEKNLQPRVLYPTKISFRFDREIKIFTDKEKLREFNTTTPAIQQMLKEHKRRKRPTITNPKQSKTGNRNIHIDNYLKCKWIECSNQKT